MNSLEILYQDQGIIAVNKPMGLASIPERDRDQGSVVGQAQQQTGQRLYVVHRLDKEVSGVLLLARTPEMHRWLNTAFSERRVHKTYAAWVHGHVTEEQGVIEAPIRAFGSGRMGVDHERGKSSRTTFEVVERHEKRTLVHAHPETGRRHQIRVHLYHLGHPILGDPRYGDKTIQQTYGRLMLHALTLEFIGPAGGCPQRIVAPIPDEFLD